MRFYISYHTKKECLVNTWHCCLMLGCWYARFRFFGTEIGWELR